MIFYKVDLSQAHRSSYLISMELTPDENTLTLSLPVWIPGSYLIREFARHLNHLNVTQNHMPCLIKQLDKATWQVMCEKHKSVHIQYEIYAHDSSVRSAYLDAYRGFFNGTSLFLRPHALESRNCQLEICHLPSSWGVATALPSTDFVDPKGTSKFFTAKNYDVLVDSPVEMGVFWRSVFSVSGVSHELVVSGQCPSADLDRLQADVQRICAVQINFWYGDHVPLLDRYVFMLHVVENGYGGLEHAQSTALICGQNDLPRANQKEATDGYIGLLGLISHEYFHCWNVKKLKPHAFNHYDYSQENDTSMLWFFEGFTSYYDDLMLLRAGLIDTATYLKQLTKAINQLLSTPGRLVQSLAQASFDAWTRYYRPDENTANTTVSYYTKGALMALALDLSLRSLPPCVANQNKPSLDDVMRNLFHLNRSIDLSDIEQALLAQSNVAPPHFDSWTMLMNAWVNEKTNFSLKTLLDSFGVHWQSCSPSTSQILGIKLTETPQGLKVATVMNAGPAQQSGISAGDEILAIDNWRVKKISDLDVFFSDLSQKTLLICRQQQLHTLTLPLLKDFDRNDFDVVHLSSKDLNPSDPAQALEFNRRQGWLRC